VTVWPRPVPLIGDTTSAADRAENPTGWAFSSEDMRALEAIIGARRDVRRFRPDAIGDAVVNRLLQAAHAAPSVGHSQPWRFIVVRDPATRAKAAWMADQQRIAQAAAMDELSARQLLALQLEGIREAPVGIVVCCDRRADAVGVLGRATFADSDMWSCACAIQNLWLTARAEGLGVGWVTLFDPAELSQLLDIPTGVETLGWLCVGYPDERQIEPGLQRYGWSHKQALADVVMTDRWTDTSAPPRSRLASEHITAPDAEHVVGARDGADELLTPPGSLGILDRALDRIVACQGAGIERATLILVGGDHLVADMGVTAFARSVTADVLAASRSGTSIGVSAAIAAGAEWTVVDAGTSSGDLVNTDALTDERVSQLLHDGAEHGAALARTGLVALGEVGVGNTTIAAALTAALLDLDAHETVGLGSGADSAMVERKRDVVNAAVTRWRSEKQPGDANGLLASLGGPEFAYLTGVVLGVSRAGGVVVLDGFATGICAAIACAIEPAVSAHVIAGQRSNEAAHRLVLAHLGVEPLLDLRLRAGEGVGAVMAASMLLNGLQIRRTAARTNGQHRAGS
jgi:nicotinate-nucleotide--dimethylbenzimidazole phosphoribosyltransferase